MPTSPQEAVRRQNLGALLRYVHLRGATSRAELTARLGLNRSTIGALTADLATAGLVDEGAPRETGRAGRPSLVVRPRSSRVYGYALSIEVDRLRAARVGLGGAILDSRTAQRPPGTEPAGAIGTLAALVHDMHRHTPAAGVLVGCGVAVTGMVRQADGTVRIHPQAGPAGETAGAALGNALGAALGHDRPPLVGDLADVAALAEHTRGAAAGFDNVLYLHGDAGIGAGIIAGGRLVTGHGGYGGEVGHMVVNPDGRPCGCGSRGCWETEIGERALLRNVGRDGATGRDAVLAVVEAALRGEPVAQAAVRHVADWLGFGVANLVNLFNPEAVVFGGSLRELYLADATHVRARLLRMALPVCREHLRLRTPVLGDDAPLVGAAELAFERLLADPLETADPADREFSAPA
ncbi:ROK family protein [Dactylosporangium fulvum]|uniref:ROK family protein n=1 Tax=Dactylosporangium fulvum TaxID=53359 RepID=A0ABY5VRT8_9ACTN|nr:ROK family transcriptional regulator [Dactylosporangium fulvum]UWP79529.1 ROK family protein [Dactylosporangium fulvum]